MSQTIEVARRGQVTIPKNVRDQYGIVDGQRYAVHALEGGILVLTPQPGKASATFSTLRESLRANGSSGLDMQADLRRMREEDSN